MLFLQLSIALVDIQWKSTPKIFCGVNLNHLLFHHQQLKTMSRMAANKTQNSFNGPPYTQLWRICHWVNLVGNHRCRVWYQRSVLIRRRSLEQILALLLRNLAIRNDQFIVKRRTHFIVKLRSLLAYWILRWMKINILFNRHRPFSGREVMSAVVDRWLVIVNGCQIVYLLQFSQFNRKKPFFLSSEKIKPHWKRSFKAVCRLADAFWTWYYGREQCWQRRTRERERKKEEAIRPSFLWMRCLCVH